MHPASDWIWLDRAVLIAAHDEQLAEHGGAAGFRDEGLFDSALARPLNLTAYESPDVCALAASYAVALAKNRPFVDGNKRTAFIAMELFLALNGHELNATDAECVLAMLSVAASEWDETTLAAWLRERTAPRT
ncbi:type II toxin-antitoxin system death-on-curing family toxin [Thiobacillus sp.]|uniref:type II toxin-antitoxin system death-on-curing family toxin n=1 Tax=Thiobacillus sp. TaxID=924 RepID=UPI0025DF0F8F|nr:type II toxin-antitoxin system death-on-curing family toxin [Thiobacillus sp.]